MQESQNFLISFGVSLFRRIPNKNRHSYQAMAVFNFYTKFWDQVEKPLIKRFSGRLRQSYF